MNFFKKNIINSIYNNRKMQKIATKHWFLLFENTRKSKHDCSSWNYLGSSRFLGLSWRKKIKSITKILLNTYPYPINTEIVHFFLFLCVYKRVLYKVIEIKLFSHILHTNIFSIWFYFFNYYYVFIFFF